MNSSAEKSSQPTYAAIDEFLAEGSAGLGKEEETATDEADALA